MPAQAPLDPTTHSAQHLSIRADSLRLICAIDRSPPENSASKAAVFVLRRVKVKEVRVVVSKHASNYNAGYSTCNAVQAFGGSELQGRFAVKERNAHIPQAIYQYKCNAVRILYW